jgi:hypothetical protein
MQLRLSQFHASSIPELPTTAVLAHSTLNFIEVTYTVIELIDGVGLGAALLQSKFGSIFVSGEAEKFKGLAFRTNKY